MSMGMILDKLASPSFVGVVDHTIHHLIFEGFLGHAQW
jgi:hypothetical protein